MIRRDFVIIRKIRAAVIGILALSSMTIGGNVFAGSPAISYDSQDDEAAGEDRGKRRETAEKPDFDSGIVKELFSFAGSSGGLDIYVRKDDSLTENELDSAEKIGDAAALYSDSGEPAAAFEKITENGGKDVFLSEGERYIAEVSSEGVCVKSVISTLDSEDVFSSENGELLELMSEDKTETEAGFRLDSEDDGRLIYREVDGSRFAWVSPEMDQFYGIYRYGAENGNFRMLVDDENAVFGLENKETGYIWWSSPLGAAHDDSATEILAGGLRSSVILNYGIPEKQSENNLLRSNTGDCDMTVTDIENGIRVEYDFGKAGFEFPVEYTLEEDYLRASLKVGDIEEKDPANIITEITLMETFGAASSEENGYFVIPDGSGALIRFNNGRTMEANAYKQPIYGRDITAVPQNRGTYSRQIYFPVYGIVKDGGNALLAVAEKGDSNACISAKISGQSKTDYNMCSFSFTLRETDTYYMSGSQNQQFTVFEGGDIKSDDIEVRYYPISKKDADYADVAARYREYLTDEKGVTPKTKADSAPLYVDLYGGVMKKRSVLGIPLNLKTAVTSYGQGLDILRELESSGAEEMVVSYNNWTNDGIKNKIDTDARPSGTLGGKKDFRELTDYMESRNIQFYPASGNVTFRSGNGYYAFTDAAVRVSGSYSRIVSYDRAYGVPDRNRKKLSLLSPGSYSSLFDDLSEGCEKAGLDGISAGALTTALYGDYSKNSVSRYDAMKKLIGGYEELCGSMKNGIMADGANAYVLPYADHIKNVPVTSSRVDIFDEDVPFYQMVIHGLIPYTVEAVNGSPDPDEMLLYAAETGSNLRYDMVYGQPGTLEDTEFDIYYYAGSSGWTSEAAESQKILEPVLSGVSDAFITGRKTEQNGDRVTVSYSNGWVITTDHSEKWIDYNGRRIYINRDGGEGEINEQR